MNSAENIIDQFRQRLAVGERPDLGDCLSGVPESMRAELLVRLVDVFNQCDRCIEKITVSDATEMFPQYRDALEKHFADSGPIHDGTMRPDITISSNSPQSTDGPEPEPPGGISDTTLGDGSTEQSQLLGDRYRLVTALGDGTYGIVYEAYDEKLRRTVALKLARRPTHESEHAEFNNFLEESRILSALDHPRILPVLDHGITSDGRQYIVSKFLAGGNLEQRIETQPLTIPAALRVVREIADALQHAHQNGLFHRDVKLANILFDDLGNPYLADFGIALRDAERRERANSIAGSPVFMSPEQIRTSDASIDGRTDIWSLGVVLYVLLTNQYPFPGGALDVLFREILERHPQPPRQLNANVSRELEQLVLRCLEKDVSKRFASAAELVEELDVLIDQANGIDTPLRAARTETKRGFASRGIKLAAAIGGALVLALATKVMLFPGTESREAEAVQEAVPPRVSADQESAPVAQSVPQETAEVLADTETAAAAEQSDAADAAVEVEPDKPDKTEPVVRQPTDILFPGFESGE